MKFNHEEIESFIDGIKKDINIDNEVFESSLNMLKYFIEFNTELLNTRRLRFDNLDLLKKWLRYTEDKLFTNY